MTIFYIFDSKRKPKIKLTLTIFQRNSIAIVEWCTVITSATECVVSAFQTFTTDRIACAFFFWINIARTLARLTDLAFNCWCSIEAMCASLTFFASVTFATCTINFVTIFRDFTFGGKALKKIKFYYSSDIFHFTNHLFCFVKTYLLPSIGNGHAQIIQSFA